MTENTQLLEVTHVAHRGDGVALLDGREVYIPYTLAGEHVRAKVNGARGQLLEVESASAHRQAPVCRHFGTCGGCALQHMDKESYATFKRQQVVDAMADRGIEADVEAPIVCDLGARRRAVFTAVRAGQKALLGYHEAKSHRLVDLVECPVLDPQITKALKGLKKLVARVIPRRGEVKITVVASAGGLDVALSGLGKNAERSFMELSQEAMALDLARLSVDGETVIEIRPPYLPMGPAKLVPPAGGFIQAAASIEDEMAQLAAAHVKGAKRIADLFCGAGTLTFRLAQAAPTLGVESDAAALKALDTALRGAQGHKGIKTQRRDLFRNPMTAGEIDNFGKGYDAVVFDPPRAGAHAQAKELAKSKVKKIAAVSCNPASLARDLRELIDGGFTLERVVVLDQFLYSPHVEVVALLHKT
ncbi:class I SAM-dependent RNA methyltransferase [Polycladidibacter hongkongensis]|uniref:class I SAM-dependent RNA methyltransferase n=1 Tax=Polycladidibacter hongkongensis TaxID=1647556 RepID=UPI000835A68F|nr:TRAM domain-containing protein [Pseudovibrio hongkongensis]